ncbi:MAG: hypothetical protein Q8R02_21215 [Hyphomonadaceae bacterium]|nr:hypothetical protein [Hyphomonadaceae bacterium]
MSLEMMGVMIPILGISIGLVAVIGNVWIKSQQIKLKIAEAQGGAEAAASRVTQAELEKLKDRVAVLERLITDDDRRVANEINRLRGSEEARG